jgi:hypothetical protein
MRIRAATIAAIVMMLAACEGGDEPPEPSPTPVEAEPGAVAMVAEDPRGVAVTPAVAVDPGGEVVYVAWTAPTERGTATFLTISRDGGSTFGPPRKIGGWTDMWPILAVADDGTLFLMWTHWDPKRLIDPASEYSNPAWQLLQRSEDQGRTFTDPVVVPDDGLSTETFYAALAVSPDASDVMVTWFDYSRIEGFGDGTDARREAVHMQSSISHDGGRSFGPVQDVTAATCVCCTPTAFFLGARTGIVYRGWIKGGAEGDVRDPMAVMGSDGDAWRPPVTVHRDDFRLRACPHMGLGAAVAGEGALYVDWWTGAEGRAGYWFARSEDGEVFTEPMQLAPLSIDPHGNDLSIAIDPFGTPWFTGVTFPGGRGSGSVVTVWSAPSDEVTELSEAEIPGSLPRITGTNDGVLVVWVDRTKIMSRRITVTA